LWTPLPSGKKFNLERANRKNRKRFFRFARSKDDFGGAAAENMTRIIKVSDF
jgi:hypothetical protein